ncbi:NAD(P)/FAD-dependent oxidoreductase [Dokdonia sinensis]|uniref:NAD(P)/FAD-dependent oxidoreductase n=1 Tax=Dokdonia sinensis TaxID=2479847 RepID=UPI001F25EFFE|nr:FAD-dependent oxidoreductase [Dokdonia sinensis]
MDYIIVGLGLAGIAFCEQCLAAGKTFLVYDKGGAGASRVAAGLYNPVILKRYTLPWKSTEQFDLAIPYFKKLEQKLETKLVHPMPVRKVFSSVEDQNNWFSASDHLELQRFMKPQIVRDDNSQIIAPFDYGEVLETGRVDIVKLQRLYETYLVEMHAFAKAEFRHNDIQIDGDTVMYDGVQAKYIIFAEGYGIKYNPYFNKLPLVGNKGEYIIIKAAELQQQAAVKSSFFIVPLGNDCYKVGATFNWTDKDNIPSEPARAELVEKLDALITCNYEIVSQQAGIRPTTGDRRALLGKHPKFPQLATLNGLGTRGIMAGPTLAQYLFEHLENDVPLPEEIDIARFPKKF